MNSSTLERPLPSQPEARSREKKKRRNESRNGPRGHAVGRFAQNDGRNSAAIGQQQLGFHHAANCRMRPCVKGQLVPQAPSEDANAQQNQGGRQRAQPQAAAGQANATKSCAGWRRSFQGRMVMMMPQSFDVFKSDGVSGACNRLSGRDLQCLHAIC